jgi:hypothetical protein
LKRNWGIKMDVTYTWEVTGLKTSTINNTSNVVVQTYWKKIGTDGTHTGTFFGATPFTSNLMPEGTTFVPFDKLTEKDVLSWIQAVVVKDYEEHVNRKIQEEIDKSMTPVEESSLPWTPNTP